MKAIYINLDPYLAAFAAWLKGGKVGTKPDFQPLPLAVTVPLGHDVAVYDPWQASEEAQTVTVDGQTVYIESEYVGSEAIEKDVVPAYSALAPSLKYAVEAVSGTSFSVTIVLSTSADQDDYTPVHFTVLVRRETASGPVDLVDFTPPAAAPTLTAAAINTALGGTGAATNAPLTGVSLTNATNAPAMTGDQIAAALNEKKIETLEVGSMIADTGAIGDGSGTVMINGKYVSWTDDPSGAELVLAGSEAS